MEKTNIGKNAGFIWHELNKRGDVIIPELARRLNLGVEDAALAVGWLARENKVGLIRKNGVLYVRNEP